MVGCPARERACREAGDGEAGRAAPVRTGHDRWASSYDATLNPVVALDRRHTLAALEPRAGERILDAGCGTGAHLRALRHSGSQPVGMDFSRGMLGVARRAAPDAGCPVLLVVAAERP